METPSDLKYHAIEMSTPEEYPRVRPILQAAMVFVGGIVLLKAGDDHEWFLGALEAGKLHNLTYFLAWGMVGMAYSVIATFLWVRWAPPSSWVRRVLACLLLLALMTAGSQVVARQVMRTVGVALHGNFWYRRPYEFVVHVPPNSDAVADAQRLGDLQTIVSVEGLWWTPSDMNPSQQLLASEVEEFAVGSPDLLRRLYQKQLSSYSAPSNQQDLEWVRFPWKPSSVKSDWAFVATVKAALVNRKGKRVGTESTFRRSEAGLQGGNWRLGPLSLQSRVEAFWKAGRDWDLQSGCPRAPFRVKTPPPQSGDSPFQE